MRFLSSCSVLVHAIATLNVYSSLVYLRISESYRVFETRGEGLKQRYLTGASKPRWWNNLKARWAFNQAYMGYERR